MLKAVRIKLLLWCGTKTTSEIASSQIEEVFEPVWNITANVPCKHLKGESPVSERGINEKERSKPYRRRYSPMLKGCIFCHFSVNSFWPPKYWIEKKWQKMNVSNIPSTGKGSIKKNENENILLVIVFFGLSKKYLFEVMMEMMRPLHPLWPATVAVQTWKYSGQSEARPTSPSPRSPSPPHSLTSQTSLNLPCPNSIVEPDNIPSWSPSPSGDFLVSNPYNIEISSL